MMEWIGRAGDCSERSYRQREASTAAGYGEEAQDRREPLTGRNWQLLDRLGQQGSQGQIDGCRGDVVVEGRYFFFGGVAFRFPFVLFPVPFPGWAG